MSAVTVTIGNFDGVHLGHRALVRTAREACGRDGRVVVLTFEPHPMSVLAPARVPPRLSTPAQRCRWLLEAGADEVVPMPPTPERLGQSPAEFLRWVADAHRPDLVVEGPDFRFGRRRAGTVQTLRAIAGELGIAAQIIDRVEAVLTDQTVVPVSSSLVRRLLALGRVRDAAACLGRPYELQAPIVAGDRRGRELEMPTANLETGDAALPADGIYAGTAVGPDGRAYPAAISVGTKPTFGPHGRVCEAHLVGYEGPVDDYGWEIVLRFGDWVREQLRFDGAEPLVAQMRRDVARVRRLAGGAAAAGVA